MKTIYFTHVYLKSGFDISKEFTSDGKDYKAPSRHYCLRRGYWCWRNVLDHPLDIFIYIKHFIERV